MACQGASRCVIGVVGVDLSGLATGPRRDAVGRRRLECRTGAGESPVSCPDVVPRIGHPSTAGHEQPCGNPGGPPPKPKYTDSPIVHEYREGTVKSTPGGE